MTDATGEGFAVGRTGDKVLVSDLKRWAKVVKDAGIKPE